MSSMHKIPSHIQNDL